MRSLPVPPRLNKGQPPYLLPHSQSASGLFPTQFEAGPSLITAPPCCLTLTPAGNQSSLFTPSSGFSLSSPPAFPLQVRGSLALIETTPPSVVVLEIGDRVLAFRPLFQNLGLVSDSEAFLLGSRSRTGRTGHFFWGFIF